MDFTISQVIAIQAIAIIIVMYAVFAIRFKRKRKGRNPKIDLEDGIKRDSDFNYGLYQFFFSKNSPKEMMKKIGMDIDDYYALCERAGETPKEYENVSCFVMGIIVVTLGFVVALVFNTAIGVILIGFGFVYFRNHQSQLKAKVEKRRKEVQKELPAFLDILQSELEIGIPVEQAIYLTASNTEGLLSDEFISALNNVKVGLYSWEVALQEMANKFQVEELSDFVLDITTAYKKGVSISDAVREKANMMKKISTFNMKKEADRVQNLIVFPTMIFKIIPLIGFLIAPTLAILMDSF